MFQFFSEIYKSKKRVKTKGKRIRVTKENKEKGNKKRIRLKN